MERNCGLVLKKFNMAFHYKTQGIILKKQDQGEANRIFTIFTKEYGKISLFAMSVRKGASKLRGGLELFSFSYLEFVQGRNKKILVEAIPLNRNFTLAYSLSSFAFAMKIVNLVDQHMAEQEKDDKVWELLSQSFLNFKNDIAPEKTYQLFMPQFMALAGYGNESFV